MPSVPHTQMDNHKLPDGNIDWAAYRKAQKDNGEYCMRDGCSEFIMFPKGHPTLCSDCKSMDEDKGDVDSDSFIRCPKCRHRMQVHEMDNHRIYGDGEHDVSCTECNHDFVVNTRVSYSFNSPELVTEPQPAEEASEEE